MLFNQHLEKAYLKGENSALLNHVFPKTQFEEQDFCALETAFPEKPVLKSTESDVLRFCSELGADCYDLRYDGEEGTAF